MTIEVHNLPAIHKHIIMRARSQATMKIDVASLVELGIVKRTLFNSNY